MYHQTWTMAADLVAKVEVSSPHVCHSLWCYLGHTVFFIDLPAPLEPVHVHAWQLEVTVEGPEVQGMRQHYWFGVELAWFQQHVDPVSCMVFVLLSLPIRNWMCN